MTADSQYTEVDIKDFLKHIRAEVAKHSALNHAHSANSLDLEELRPTKIRAPSFTRLSLPEELNIQDEFKRSYDLQDFLKYQDRDFIYYAYRALLHRDPDEVGLQLFLNSLRNGKSSRTEVLGTIRFSREGRQNRVTVKGLLFPFVIHKSYKLPLLGKFIFFVAAFLQLPEMSKTLRQLAASYHLQQITTRNHLNILALTTEKGIKSALENLTDQANSALSELRRVDTKTSIKLLEMEQRLAHIVEMQITNLQLRVEVLSNEKANRSEVTEDFKDFLARLEQIDKIKINEIEKALEGIKLGKASVSQTEKLASQLDALEGYLKELRQNDQIKISKIEATLEDIERSKARVDQIERIVSQLGALEEYIKELQQNDQIKISKIEATLEDIKRSKASVSQTERLASQLGTLENFLAELRQIGQIKISEIESTIEDVKLRKANNEEIIKIFQRIDTQIEEKVGVAQVEDLRATLDRRLEDKEHEIHSSQQTLREVRNELISQKRNLLDQERRVSLLLKEAQKRLPSKYSRQGLEKITEEQSHLLDSFYVDFEDHFRGNRSEIKKRISTYLPYVKDVNAGSTKAPVLDIGCGRGEWLELLKEEDYVARGVDINRVMVDQCRKQGLDVKEADAITYLQKVRTGSIGMVTGFHIIEHLPIRQLITLIDESLRALKRGGVAIFETPNPENLIVGACNFYFDPTHLNPLPPGMMVFLLQSRGFSNVQPKRLHPGPQQFEFQGLDAASALRLKQLISGWQDYAVIGYKE